MGTLHEISETEILDVFFILKGHLKPLILKSIIYRSYRMGATHMKISLMLHCILNFCFKAESA